MRKNTSHRGELLPLKVVIPLLILLFSITVFGFRIIGMQQDGTGQFNIQYESSDDSYYVLYQGEQVGAITNANAMSLGLAGTGSITSQNATITLQGFYRIHQVPLNTPSDTDGDGMDDVYELNLAFLDPLDSADGTQDEDNDGLYNYGEYLLNTDPTDPDSDNDWVIDGYEVFKGTSPTDPASAPFLEFRINDNVLYTSNTTVSLNFGPHIADEVALSESPDMSGAIIYPFSKTLPYTFTNTENGWRHLFIRFRRNSAKAKGSAREL